MFALNAFTSKLQAPSSSPVPRQIPSVSHFLSESSKSFCGHFQWGGTSEIVGQQRKQPGDIDAEAR